MADTVMTLTQVGDRLAAARSTLAEAMDSARAAAVEASGLGFPDSVIALQLGVTRMTVRAWLGKGPRANAS